MGYSGCTLYLPYLTLHMVQIGLNIEEIAIIYSVLPFATSIVPPVAGLLNINGLDHCLLNVYYWIRFEKVTWRTNIGRINFS